MAVWGWIAAGLAAAGALLLVQKTSAAKTQRSLPRLTASSRVLLIGDSLAVGLKSPLSVLASADGLAFRGAGIGGTHIGSWTGGHLSNALAFNPTLVLVSLGTNDAYMMVDDVWARQEPKLRMLLEKIRAQGAEIVWIGPPSLPDPYGRKSVDQNFLVQLRAHAPNYMDSTGLDLPRADRLHPTGAGYQQWASEIWNAIR